MGAVSIVGGAMFGVMVRHNQLDPVEWVILAAIMLLVLYWLLQTT